MDDFIIYTMLNIGITPLVKSEDKPKGKIYDYGILINLTGNLLYQYIFKNIGILPYQEHIFKISYQAFIDSLLFNEISPVIVDSLLVLGSIKIKDSINA